MTTKKKGFLRGILYPLVAVGAHFVLALFIAKGWLSDAGALAFTGFVGYVDHEVLPNINSL